MLKKKINQRRSFTFYGSVHPTQATKLTWLDKTGVDKTIKTTGSRTRLNIVGALSLGNICDAIIAQYKTINNESITDFLGKIKKFYRNKENIYLVLDSAGYHRSYKVVEKAKNLGINLHYLPPYSPNSNPIKRLWKVMNKYSRNNRYFANAQEFR